MGLMEYGALYGAKARAARITALAALPMAELVQIAEKAKRDRSQARSRLPANWEGMHTRDQMSWVNRHGAETTAHLDAIDRDFEAAEAVKAATKVMALVARPMAELVQMEKEAAEKTARAESKKRLFLIPAGLGVLLLGLGCLAVLPPLAIFGEVLCGIGLIGAVRISRIEQAKYRCQQADAKAALMKKSALVEAAKPVALISAPSPEEDVPACQTTLTATNDAFLRDQGLIDSFKDVALDVATKPTLNFTSHGNGVPYLRQGWSRPENWGVWSQEATASLELPLTKAPSSDLMLNLTTGAFVPDNRPAEQVDVLLNGTAIAKLNFTSMAKQHQTLRLPVNVIGEQTTMNLLFRPSAPVSPHELGLSGDGRKLGVSLTELQLT